MRRSSRVVVATLYLQHSVGINDTNAGLLAALGQEVDRRKLPVLAGGDFNVLPSVVKDTDLPQRIHATIVAPAGSTFRGRRVRRAYDFSSCPRASPDC